MAKRIDYTSFSENGKKKRLDTGAEFVKRWWLAEDKDLPDAVIATLKIMSEFSKEKQRQYQYSVSNRLYGNQDLLGVTGFSSTKISDLSNGNKTRITYNVIQSATDTLTSKICKNRPKAMFVTSGGDWKLQKQAKALEKFVDGVFYENKFYTHVRKKNIVDSIVFGDGMAKVFAKDGRPCIERVNPRRIYTDWIESLNGAPRQMMQVDLVDRDVLIDCYPDLADKIRAASSASLDAVGLYSATSDQLMVVEAWHLPSGPDAGDGRHCIVVNGCTLYSEEWAKPYFPFAKLPFNERTEGYWSQGGAEQIQGTQLEINKIMWRISRSLDLGSTFKVWIKNGSKIVKEHINNELGTIINSDEPPQYMTPPIVQPEIYARLQAVKQEAFELFGISQLSAQSQKPAGLDSGKALRTYANIESERFMTFGKADEQYILDCAYLIIECARDIVAEGGSLTVKAQNKKVVEEINFKENDIEDSDFILKMFPVSNLPSDPEGRLQTIQEYMQAGLINPRMGRRLMDFPDLESMEDLQNAKEDYLHKILEKIIEEGEMTAPEPEDDLALAQELFLDYYAYAKVSGVDEERLELLRQFNDQTKQLMQAAMAPPPPAPGMGPEGGGVMPGVQQGVGQAPPQSALLPQGA
jgi:hypothetical protein